MKIRNKAILIAAVMAAQTVTASAASVSVGDISTKRVDISDLSGSAKIIAVDFIGEDDIDDQTEGVQTFEFLTDAEKSAVIADHTKYIRQLTTGADHSFVLPEYGAYTVFVKEGSGNTQAYELTLFDPDFVSRHTGAQTAAALEANLTGSQSYMRGALAKYFALLPADKTDVATRVFEEKASDTTADLIAKRVNQMTVLQNIINAENEEKITIFESNDELLGYSAYTDIADYNTGDATFKAGVLAKFAVYKNDDKLIDTEDEFDDAFGRAVFLQKIKSAATAQEVSQLVGEAKEKFGISTPKYNKLGTKTSTPDNAVKGNDYASIEAFVTALENNSKSNSGGGGGAVVDRENNNGKDVTIGLPFIPTTPENKQEEALYTDVASDRWSYTPIYVLTKQGVISGDGDGTFRPTDGITRQEFVKIAVSAFGLTDEAAQCDFSDVPKTSWAYQYIATAKQYGLVSGVTDEVFAPTANITREEATVIMHNIAKFRNVPLKANGDAPAFDDGDKISDWAEDAVVNLYKSGIIDGMSETEFAPKNNITREQAAKIVYTMLRLVS